jgi:hypothetical protein
MSVFIGLLLASSFLLLLAVALTMLGVVGLALRWTFQVWSGGGSHRPYDWDATDAVGSPWRHQSPSGGHLQDGLDSHENI